MYCITLNIPFTNIINDQLKIVVLKSIIAKEQWRIVTHSKYLNESVQVLAYDGGTDLSLTMEVQIFRFPTEVQNVRLRCMYRSFLFNGGTMFRLRCRYRSFLFDGGTMFHLRWRYRSFVSDGGTDLLLTFSLTRFRKKMDFLNLTTVSDTLHTVLSYFIFNQQVQIFRLRWRYRTFVFRRPSCYRDSRCDVVHYSDSLQ